MRKSTVILGRGCRQRAPVLLLGAACAVALPASAQQAGDRSLFVAYGCYQCHGYEGQGGAAVRIAPSAYPFDAFAALIRRPANEMPAYAPAQLSDEDLRAIYRYVRSRPEPEPRADIPLLR